MDREATLAIKHAAILLVAAVAVGCSASLGKGDAAVSDGGGMGGGGGSTAGCCPDGGQPFASVVHGRGFSAYEGRPVQAILLYSTTTVPNRVANQTTTVSGGTFDLDFAAAGGSCNDTSRATGGGAIYIDSDGDGVCDPAVDYLYVWPAFDAMGSNCGTIDLSPQTPKCAAPIPDATALYAAVSVCPATRGCLMCPWPSVDGGIGTTCVI